MAKNPMTSVKSPRVELEWVTINDGEGKENLSGKQQYVANGVFINEDELKAFQAEIQKFWDENKPKGYKGKMKSSGLYDHKALKVDEDGNAVKDEDGKNVYEEDGRTYVAFKTGIEYADGSEKLVKIHNAKGRRVELPEGTKIGNGSEGRLGGMMAIYTTTDKSGKTIVNAGVTFYLNSIQIFKLEEFVGQDDFTEADAEEGGWTGDDDTFEGEEPSTSDAKGKPRL